MWRAGCISEKVKEMSLNNLRGFQPPCGVQDALDYNDMTYTAGESRFQPPCGVQDASLDDIRDVCDFSGFNRRVACRMHQGLIMNNIVKSILFQPPCGVQDASAVSSKSSTIFSRFNRRVACRMHQLVSFL